MSILTKIVTTIFGSKSEKDLKEINPLVNEVNSIFATLENLSDDELKEKFSNHRKEIKSIRNDTMVRCQSEKLSSKETDDLIYNDEQKYLNDKMCEILENLYKEKKILDHGLEVGKQLAFVLSGGNTTENKLLGEEDIYALELDAFMNLIQMPKTQERIKHTLETGKPLVN